MKKLLSKVVSLITVISMVCATNVAIVSAAVESTDATLNYTNYAVWSTDNAGTGQITTGTAITNAYGGMGIQSNGNAKQTTFGSLMFSLPAELEGKIVIGAKFTGYIKISGNGLARPTSLCVYDFPTDWSNTDVELEEYPALPESGEGALGSIALGTDAITDYTKHEIDLSATYFNNMIASDTESFALAFRQISTEGYTVTGASKAVNLRLKTNLPTVTLTYIDKPLTSVVADVEEPDAGSDVVLTVNTTSGFDGDVELYDGTTLLTTLTGETGYTYTVEGIESGVHTYTAKTTVEGVECKVSTIVTAYSSTETVNIPVSKNMNFKRKATSGTDAKYLAFSAGDMTNSSDNYGLKGNPGSAGQRTYGFLNFDLSSLDLTGKAIVGADVVISMKSRWTSNAETNPSTEGKLDAFSWNDEWAATQDVTALGDVLFEEVAVSLGASDAIALPDVNGTAIKVPVTDYINSKINDDADMASVVIQYERAAGASGNEQLNYYTVYADEELRPYLQLTTVASPVFSDISITDGDIISRSDAVVTGNVSVDNAEITQVKMYVDGTESNIEVAYNSGSFSADLSDLSIGNHSIYFQASADNAATAISKAINISITDETYSIKNLHFANSSGQTMTEIFDNAAVTAKCVVENLGDGPMSVRLIIASYSSNNRLKDVNVCDIATVAPGGKPVLTTALTLGSVAEDDYVKAFLWDDFDAIKPYRKAIKISK